MGLIENSLSVKLLKGSKSDKFVIKQVLGEQVEHNVGGEGLSDNSKSLGISSDLLEVLEA